MLALEVLCIVFLSNNLSMGSAGSLLLVAGCWGLFKKCGEPAWHALIPCYRQYALGKCAGREYEGKIIFTMDFIWTVLTLITTFSSEAPQESDLQTALLFTVVLVSFIFQIRLYLGLIGVFARKKKWLFLWLSFPGIAAFIWGWLKKFQPEVKVEDFRSELENFFSTGNAAVLEKGLTVNLTERTASDFFKKKTLLKDIHLNVEPGNMVLLLGGSGAGKTTFVNAVNGYEPAKAEIILNGANVYKSYKDMKYDIGFVPQQDLMRGTDTVLHTLLDAAMLRLPRDFTNAKRRERVEEVMEIFGLTPVRDSLVSKLSGGQRKRLSISMEFISNPSLFILDEPDSGLDGVMARELMQQLRRIADQGKIVIVITHTPDRVIDLFDDVIVLAKDNARTGRLAWFGPVPAAREFFGKQSMEEIVKSVNRTEEGGEGRADEFIRKYAEVQHA